MLVEVLGDSPKGSRVCFHRQPRNIWARIPKGKERSIQVQSISCVMTWKNRPKSSPLYIQYNIAPPRRMGKMILAALMKTVFNSMGAKIRISERNTKFIWIFPRCQLSSSKAHRHDTPWYTSINTPLYILFCHKTFPVYANSSTFAPSNNNRITSLKIRERNWLWQYCLW